MLVTFSELSNIFSILAVLICFCAMILFITRNMMVLRIHGEDLVFPTTLHHQVSPRIPQMNMMKVHIPFTFKLVETSKSSYADVQCSISSQVRYCVCAFWGASIRELHVCLWKPWKVLRDTSLNGELLQRHCLQTGFYSERNPHSDETITLSLPAPPLELGTPPRLRYPLVIFLMRTDPDEQVHPDETVALINVVHIKDTVCTLPTSVLAQYLKQANGQLSCLKQLYLATGNSGNYDDESATEVSLTLAEPIGEDGATDGQALLCENDTSATDDDGDSGSVWKHASEQLCVVCQYFPLSRALLPCRHTCICASCFDKLDRCPMCRGPIKSYFCIRGEEYMPIQTKSPNKHVPHAHRPLYNWLDSWNDRLTDFLGFQR
ncbi:Mahogunin ring finger 1 [Carabus blaptoides fortunei]